MVNENGIRADLYRDWVEFSRNQIIAFGYNLSGNENDDDLTILYFNIVFRHIEPLPRKVLLSHEFILPTDSTGRFDYNNNFNELKRKIEAGEDINPYLSRRIVKLDYNDPMLNDWGVQHFHLGQTTMSSGLIEGTKHVIFAKILYDTAYIIQAYDHDHWTDGEVLTILHSNWPELLEPHRIHGIYAIKESRDSDLGQIRKAHINPTIDLGNGNVFAPLGGGVVMNGRSMELIRKNILYKHSIRSVEKWIINNSDSIREALRQNGITIGSPIRLRLIFADNGSFLCDESDRNIGILNLTNTFGGVIYRP